MTWPVRPAVLLCLVLAAGTTPGCRHQPARRNLLLVTLDTTRADHLGCYGFAEAHTPRLDEFARERAVRFEQAITTAPLTLPAHTSILTGTYPVHHGVHDNDGYYVAEDVTTLAELLSAAGYETAAVVASFPVDSQFNLDQGFATYDDDYQEDWTADQVDARTSHSFGFLERKGDLVNRAVRRWFEHRSEKPFFLWVHYFDPHQPYDPPKPYDSLFPQLYDGEIAFADECFGALLEELKRRELLEQTVVVVVGDHGEALEEHGEPTHATYVYDATMHVPLLVASPDPWLARGQAVQEQVSTVDIAPTILALLGLPAPPQMQGESLVGALSNPASHTARPILLESYFGLFQFGWAPLRALRTGHFKLVEAPRPELYDLESDPGELDNLALARPETMAELQQQLDQLAAQLSWPDPGRSASTSIDQEARARLAALGYLGGGGAAQRALPFPNAEELARLPNPLDGALALHYVNVTSELIRNQRYDEAVMVGRQGLEVDPDNYRLQYNLGYAYFGSGQQDRALAELERARQMNPSDPSPYLLLGRIHGNAERLDQARACFERAVELEPNRLEGLELLGLAYGRLGDMDAAAKTLRRAIAVDPGSWSTHLRLGRVLADSGHLEEARQALEEAMHLDPYSPEVLDTIGVFYLQLGNLEFSRQALEQAYRVAPDNPLVNLHLAEALLRTGGHEEEARGHLSTVIRVAPASNWANAARRYLEQKPPGEPEPNPG